MDNYKIEKRIFDFFLASALFFLAFPLFLYLFLLIKIDSKGKIFIYLKTISRVFINIFQGGSKPSLEEERVLKRPLWGARGKIL